MEMLLLLYFWNYTPTEFGYGSRNCRFGGHTGAFHNSQVISEQGGDIEDVFDQLAYEQALAKEKGLILNGVSQEGASDEESD